MLLVLAAILAIAWIFGFTVFHVAGAAIHILLILAVVGLIAHLVRGAAGPRS
ncbi:MAG: lmo0937 family membrane protein [Kofleriaceae bacterium]